MGLWNEVGAHVFVRRYAFFDQNIVVVRGEDQALVVDTRTTNAQASELLEDIRSLTNDPLTVVNTHHHFDHTDGNALFRPAAIWGHRRCAEVLREVGRERLDEVARKRPELAAELAEVEIVPPDRTFAEAATLLIGGRIVELRFAGRGHTDNDVVVLIPDASVVVAGDLVEEGAPPSFGDSFPLEWPVTLESVLPWMTGPVVPGHGAVVERTFVEAQMREIADAARSAEAAHADGLDIDDASSLLGYPQAVARSVVDRVYAQLDGVI